MKMPNNAFLLYGYHSPEYFCSRKQELKQLKNHRLNERNVALYSWRGMGRSALIHRFLIEEERKGKLETIYVDLTGTTHLEKLVEILIKGVYERYANSPTSIEPELQLLLNKVGINITYQKDSSTPQFFLGYRNEIQLTENLKSIGQFLSYRKKKVFLVFKEFQQITRYEEEHIESILNNFTQNQPSIRFIFSGSHRQKMVDMFTDSNRAFYKSCQMLSLEPIPEKEYVPFIRGHFNAVNREVSTELIHEIYSWTRGLTQAMQLICNKLYGTNRTLNNKNLQEVISETLQENALVFANYHRLLTKVQWKLIVAIAKENEVKTPQAAAFLSKYNLGAASSVKVALDALISKELVISENGAYHVHDLLFFRWLEQL